MDLTNKTGCASAFLKLEKKQFIALYKGTTKNICITLWNFKYRVLFADFKLIYNYVSLSLTSTSLRKSTLM